MPVDGGDRICKLCMKLEKKYWLSFPRDIWRGMVCHARLAYRDLRTTIIHGLQANMQEWNLSNPHIG